MFRYPIIFLLFASLFLCLSTTASALQLQVASGETTPNNSVSLNVSVNNPIDISAALFKLSYNKNYLQLTGVDSTFFDTFENQWSLLNPAPQPTPPTGVTVDGNNYTQPVLFNITDSGAMVIGIRVQPGAAETTLFTLHFDIAPGTPDGIYPVTICPVIINQGAIPILVGINDGEPDPANAYINLNPTLVSGVIAVNTPVIDSDNDGIDDAWEIHYFGNLTTANATSDFDKDGYTDLQEYLNQLAKYTDSNGMEFDPTKKNAPNGDGYTGTESNSKFWLLMLPAILSGQQAN